MTEHVEVLIPEEDVNRRITEVAEEINRDYARFPPIGTSKNEIIYLPYH